ncbi:unnamed protein product [Psylliodes chrysocephalus]|uniref:DUF4806 domain-containing protein n=1 Tax=Psylliodes chrysocephalus TaxID=3402493 RepID=A0A9P0CTP2_9CUCU|nr:unnamed protein product [Psylliodes chrysocephala]
MGNQSQDEVFLAAQEAVGAHRDSQDGDVQEIKNSLEEIISLLTMNKLDMEDIKQRLGGIRENPANQTADAMEEVPVTFPLATLTNIEELEDYVKTDTGKNAFQRHIKKIGGNDSKDFILRILRHTLTNSLAELLSWTGRKGNFPIKQLLCINIIFGAVHRAFKCSLKEFEIHVREWLRHARQRKLREERKQM